MASVHSLQFHLKQRWVVLPSAPPFLWCKIPLPFYLRSCVWLISVLCHVEQSGEGASVVLSSGKSHFCWAVWMWPADCWWWKTAEVVKRTNSSPAARLSKQWDSFKQQMSSGHWSASMGSLGWICALTAVFLLVGLSLHPQASLQHPRSLLCPSSGGFWGEGAQTLPLVSFQCVLKGITQSLMLPGFPFWFSRAFSSLNKTWLSANKRLWLSKLLFLMLASRGYFKSQKTEHWLFYSFSFSLHSGCTNPNSPEGNASDLLGERSSGKKCSK